MSKQRGDVGLPIRLPKDADKVLRDFAREVESLSGMPYPPTNNLQWIELLTRAGFAQERIEQMLHFMGYIGFEDVGELPRVYVSLPGDGSDGNWPVFSAMLIAGLRQYKRDSRIPEEDGPDDVGNFWWDDVPYAIANKSGGLLAFIFEHQPASDQDIADDFYKQSDKPADSIRKAVNRLNDDLLSLGAPFSVERSKSGPSRIVCPHK